VLEKGIRFGKLTVVELLPIEGDKPRKVRCRCDCGRESTPFLQNLRSGRSTSCGNIKCGLRKYKPRKRKHRDMIGKIFGYLKVLSEDATTADKWLCECHCGTKRTVSGQTLRNGASKSCGCGRYIKAKGHIQEGLGELKNSKLMELTTHKYMPHSERKHRKHMVIKFRKKGMSYATIGKIFGLTRQAVHLICKINTV
jgi:hypothetical protein